MALTTVQSELFYLPGVTFEYWGLSAPNGWVFASGKTIGNASSNADGRANADCFNLFSLLWNYDGTQAALLQMWDSSGSPVSRGANAIADWNANRAISTPDCRGRARVGRDDMGGSAASRITSASGITGTQAGSSGGEQVHQLVVGEMPYHTHSSGTLSTGGVTANHTHTVGTNQSGGGGGGYVPGSANTNGPSAYPSTSAMSADHAHYVTGGSTGSQGSDGSHLNVQPTIICNVIIKL